MEDNASDRSYILPTMIKKPCIAAALALALGAAAFASPRVVKLQEAVDAALNAGDEVKIAQGGVDAARSANELAISKAGLSLSGSGSYALTDGLGSGLKELDPVKGTLTPTASSLSGLVGKSGLAHKLDGSLSLSAGNASASNPYSKLTLSVSESIPPASVTSAPAAPSPVTPTTTIGASLAQMLWDGYPGGQTKASIDKASLAFQIAEQAARQARSAAVSAVKKAYVTMLTAQRSFALGGQALERQALLVKQIEATFALQQASAIDLMSARIAARKAELDLETSRHDLSLATQRLAALMGLASDADFAVAEIEEPPLPAASAEAASASGLAKRADAAQIQLRKRSAAIDLALAKAGSQPGVSMTAGFNMGIVGGDAPGNAGSANLGFKLTLPLLDAGAAKAQVASVVALLDGYDAQEAQLAKKIAADIRDYYWSATILSDRIGLAKMNQELNDNKLALAKTQFQFGTMTTQDLLSAQADAAKAASDYLAAKAAYLVQELDLETAMGI